MKAEKVLYIVRLVLEWGIVGCAAVAMVCDILEPGSTNGGVWALMAALSGIRCIMGVHQNRRLEKSRDAWMETAQRALGVLRVVYEGNKRRLEQNRVDENDLK